MKMKNLILFLAFLGVFMSSMPETAPYFGVKSAYAQKVQGVDIGIKKKTLTAATGNNFTAGSIGYVDSSGTVALTDATNLVSSKGLLVMALETVNAGNSGTFRLLEGEYTTTGLTPGATYYLDTTSGQLTTTAPTTEGSIQRPIGVALNATTLIFGPVNSTLTTAGAPSGGGGTTPTTGPVVVEASSSAYAATSPETITAPIDIQNGELLYLFQSVDYSATGNSTMTQPTDFIENIAYARVNAGAAGIAYQSWYKEANNESGNYTLTESDGTHVLSGIMLRISGVDPADAIDTQSCSSGTAEPVTAPDVTATVDNAVILRLYAWDESKTLTLAPSGVTVIAHNDNSGIDTWAGYEEQATSGATGTAVMDISAGTRWVACTVALKQAGATSTGGGSGGAGGGAGDTEGAGPFSLLDDGASHSTGMKLTIPTTCAGGFSGSACEIFPNNDSHWTAGDPDLATYTNATYFKRDPAFYTFCSPNTGATTATASNGRSELRYLFNWTTGVIDRQYKFRFRDEDVVTGLKSNNGQLHRGGTESSPVYKGTYGHTVVRANTAQAGASTTITLDASASASDDAYNGNGITITSGTGVAQVRHITDYVGATKVATVSSAWTTNPDSTSVFEIGSGNYRILTKKTEGAGDFSFDADGGGPLGDKEVLKNLVSNSFIRIRRQYDIPNQTLKIWASDDEDTDTDAILTGTPTVTLTGVVLGSGANVYEKDGMYMNSAGSGSNTTPYCVQYYQAEWTLGQ